MLRVLPHPVSDPLPLHIVTPQNRPMSATARVFVEGVGGVCEPSAEGRGARPAVPPQERAAA